MKPHTEITPLTPWNLAYCQHIDHLDFPSLYIEKRILRRIFESKRDENGERRRFHNEELHILYRSLNIVRMIKTIRLMSR